MCENEIPPINIHNFFIHRLSCYIVFRQENTRLSTASNSGWIVRKKKKLICIFSSGWPLNWELVPEACLLVSQPEERFKYTKIFKARLSMTPNERRRIWHLLFGFRAKRKKGTFQKLMHFDTWPFSLFAAPPENM